MARNIVILLYQVSGFTFTSLVNRQSLLLIPRLLLLQATITFTPLTARIPFLILILYLPCTNPDNLLKEIASVKQT